MPPDRAIWEWVDNASGFLRAANWVVPASSTGALEVAMQNAANPELLYATIAAPTIGAASPGTTQYHLVQDIALLNFATAVAGSNVQLVLPGPLAAVFGANSQVLDPLAALTAAVIAAAIGVLADINGNPVTAYISGSKASRKADQP